MAVRLMVSWLFLAGLASVVVADVVPSGKKDQAKKDAPLEQQLLDDLDADLLDDLKSDGEDFGATTGDNGDEHPFLTIGREMREAGELIGQRKSAEETQQLQEKIVQRLDALIQQIRRQQKQQSASKKKIAGSTRQTPQQPNKNPSGKPGDTAKKPPRDSEDRVGKSKPRKVDMAAMTKLMEDLWGDLPPRARPEMRQDSSEEFLPKYELKIERYFRRLAEQRRDE